MLQLSFRPSVLPSVKPSARPSSRPSIDPAVRPSVRLSDQSWDTATFPHKAPSTLRRRERNQKSSTPDFFFFFFFISPAASPTVAPFIKTSQYKPGLKTTPISFSYIAFFFPPLSLLLEIIPSLINILFLPLFPSYL